MTTDESPRSGSPSAAAERLLELAEARSGLRASLIERWSRAETWSLVEGIALAWTLDPATLGTEEALRREPEVALPEEAQHYLAMARRSSSLSAGRITPSRFIEWAQTAGLAFHPDWHDGIERARSQMEDSRTRDGAGRRRHLIKRWARAAHWEPEEGVALVCDLDPDKAIVHSAAGYAHPSIRGSDDGNHLLKLAYRAIDGSSLAHNPTPIEFMKWARSMGVEFHSDWWDAVVSPQPSAREEADLMPPAPSVAELKTRERESLLRMVIGMAVCGYRWNPNAARNSATADIANDLERAGVPLDADTILKWLRQGAELLPPENA